jgi:hypothetical protein
LGVVAYTGGFCQSRSALTDEMMVAFQTVTFSARPDDDGGKTETIRFVILLLANFCSLFILSIISSNWIKLFSFKLNPAFDDLSSSLE